MRAWRLSHTQNHTPDNQQQGDEQISSVIPTHARFYGCGLPYLDDLDLGGPLIVIEGSDCSGRSTQAEMLKESLESQGHAVLEMGIRRSDLLAKAISSAKQGNLLGKTTLSLLYATDLADQLENRIVPAMQAGFVVLADRYIYTLMARDLARGADLKWLKRLFGIALEPDLIVFLDAEPEVLFYRTLAKYGELNYWESGMDLQMGSSMFESFLKYQASLRKNFHRLADEYGFRMIDATPSPKKIHKQITEVVSGYLARFEQSAPSVQPDTGQKAQAVNRRVRVEED